VFLSIPAAGLLTGALCFAGFFGPLLFYGAGSEHFESIRLHASGIFGGLALVSVIGTGFFLCAKRDSLDRTYVSFVLTLAAHVVCAFSIPAILCIAGVFIGAAAAVIGLAAVVVLVWVFPIALKVNDDDADEAIGDKKIAD
jgi:hypothetical protein